MYIVDMLPFLSRPCLAFGESGYALLLLDWSHVVYVLVHYIMYIDPD